MSRSRKLAALASAFCLILLAGMYPSSADDEEHGGEIRRKEHREIPASVLKRRAIGSLSNCAACHKRADEGVFEDDWVKIPRAE